MNQISKHFILICLMSLLHISMNAQSIIKYVSGKVYLSDTNELIEE